MADIVRVSIAGQMPGGEVWSVNPTFKITSGAVITGSECTAAAIAIAALTLPTGLKAVMSNKVTFNKVRVEARTHAGVLEAQGEALRAAEEVGSGAVSMPFQSSMVISLRSLAPGGRGRGRLYWPALAGILDTSTVRIVGTTVDNALTGAKTFLTAVQGALDASVDETVGLAVWSRTGGSSSLVTKLIVGDVVDSQRRRRDAIPETYKEVAYV